MDYFRATAKKIIFWTYPRTSWQWDVLCVLILVFIFLTPKSWFENSQYRRSHTAQTTVVLPADVIGSHADRREIERRVREVAGRADAQITEIREQRDGSGSVIRYEVDIR